LTLRALHKSHDGVRFGLTPAASSWLLVLLPTTLAEDAPSAAVVVIPASRPVLLLLLFATPGVIFRFLGAVGPGPGSEAVELACEDMARRDVESDGDALQFS
jgi:hypothetical protein